MVLVGNAWRVDVTHPLPVLSDPGTAIDGTAYNATDGVSVRDQNAGLLGVGGTVGIDQLSLPTVDKPELVIYSPSSTVVPVGLNVQASNVTVRRIAIYGFGGALNSDTSANILISSAASNVVIEQNLLGTTAGSFS